MTIKSMDNIHNGKINFSIKDGPGLAIQEKIMGELLTIIA
jgi:hypothetical protein